MPFSPCVVEALLSCSRIIVMPTCQGPSGVLSSTYLLFEQGGAVPYIFHRVCWDCTTDFEKMP